jgi:LmbE family N-acetylglucosaminyl deacetylase
MVPTVSLGHNFRDMDAPRVSLLSFVLLSLGLNVLGQQTRPSQPSLANPFSQVREKTILVITPHPDDDIIGCGGALAFLAGHANRLIVVFLTAGEKGTFDTRLTPEMVRTIRMQEAAAAYRVLGFAEAELVWLPYPDGELDFAPLREIRIKLVEIIRKRRPDIVFAIDPGATYYRYHYRDHRAAALVSADAIGAAMWPLEYPETGPAYRAPEIYYFYTAEPTLRLDIDSVYNRKLSALAQHRSQFAPASNRYLPDGPPPSREELEKLIVFLTADTKLELFRRR